MPRINPPTPATMQRWIANVPELQYPGVGTHLYCTACDTRFVCTQRQHVQRHISQNNHKSNIGLPTQTIFNIELTRFMVGCNIAWNQLNNPIFTTFLQNCINGQYTNMSMPSDSLLRTWYFRTESNRVKHEIFQKIGENNIWISVNETTNASGRSLAIIVVGILVETTQTKRYVIACKEMEEANAETIVKLVDACLKEMWDDHYYANRGKLLLLLTDNVDYMKEAGELLTANYINMLHLTCLSHALNNVAETVGKLYPKVNQMISNTKQLFTKSPQSINLFQQMLPSIPLPPETELRRWETWLKAASYYYCYFKDIKNVIEHLEEDETMPVSEVKKAFNDPDIISDLTYIHAHFFRISPAMTALEESKSLTEGLNIIFDLRNYFAQLSGEVAEHVKVKFATVLNTNPGFRSISFVSDLLNKKEVDSSSSELNLATLRHYKFLKYAPVAYAEVERTFPQVKWLFTDKRKRLTPRSLEAMLLICCNTGDVPNIQTENE